MTRITALTAAAALGSATVGGVLYAFSTFVMQALDRLPPADGIRAMQSINVTAMRPGFGLLIAASLAVTVPVVVMAFRGEPGTRRTLLLVGGALYLVGGLGVTVAFNVPRNEALAHVDPTAGDAAAVWARYVTEWTRWNHVRTAAALAAAACFLGALTTGRDRSAATTATTATPASSSSAFRDRRA